MGIMLLLFCCFQIIIAQSNTITVTSGNSLKQLLCNNTLPPNTHLMLDGPKLIIEVGDEETEFCLMENTTDVSITASPNILSEGNIVEVNCVKGMLGFGFFNITNLTIRSVMFVNCRASISTEAVKFVNESSQFLHYSDDQLVSIFFSHCCNLKLDNVQVRVFNNADNTSMGLVGVNLCGNSEISEYKYDSPVFLHFTDSTVISTAEHSLKMISHSISRPASESGRRPTIQDIFRDGPERLPVLNYGDLALFLAQTFAVNVVLHLDTSQHQGTLTHTPPVYVLVGFVNNIGSSFVSFQGVSNEYCDNILQGFGQRPLVISTVFYETPSFNSTTDELEAVSSTLLVKNTSFLGMGKPGLFQIFQFTKTLSHQVSFENVSWCNNIMYSSPSFDPLFHAQNQEKSAHLYLKMHNLNMHENFFFANHVKSSSCLICFENIREISLTGTSYIASNSGGSAISVISSNLSISGNLTVNNGHALEGGGIRLDSTSTLFLKEPLVARFSNNKADKGSAIYAPIKSCTTNRVSTIQVVPKEEYSIANITSIEISLYFTNNSEGQLPRSFYAPYFSIFGNQTSPNFLFQHDSWDLNHSQYAYTTLIDTILFMEEEMDRFTSLANGHCMQHRWSNWECNYIDQKIRNAMTTASQQEMLQTLRIYPGQTAFTIYYIDYLHVYSIEYCTTESSSFESYKYWDYELFRHNSTQTYTLELSPNENCFVTLFSNAEVNIFSLPVLQVQFNSCPVGFCLDNNHYGSCVCDTKLLQHNYNCNIDGPSITAPENYWTSFKDINTTIVLIFNDNCPPNYCSKDSHDVVYFDHDPASLCLDYRTGDLCGECKENYSMVFGSDKCYDHCTNLYLFTLPLYAVAGIVLVLVLFLLRLTLATGTINGLIFYANVLGLVMDKLTENTTNHYTLFVRIWIYLFNLDLGFPLCLYKDMTTAAKVGLQFMFPTYLWSIIVVLILSSKFSVRVSKLISNSSVQVLTTVFYLSFSKILHTVIVILSHSSIHSIAGCGEYNVTLVYVWFYNGKEYGGSEHIILLFLAIAFTLLFLLPYALLVTFSSCFVRFSAVNKFRPFIEAYGGPFKDKWRFWFGIRLWIIILLFSLDGAFGGTDSNILFVVHTFVITLFLLVQLFIRPFKNTLIGILDASFMLNYLFLVQMHIYFKISDIFGAYIFLTAAALAVTCLIFLFHICALKYPDKLTNLTRRQEYDVIKNEPDVDLDFFQAAEEHVRAPVVD